MEIEVFESVLALIINLHVVEWKKVRTIVISETYVQVSQLIKVEEFQVPSPNIIDYASDLQLVNYFL